MNKKLIRYGCCTGIITQVLLFVYIKVYVSTDLIFISPVVMFSLSVLLAILQCAFFFHFAKKVRKAHIPILGLIDVIGFIICGLFIFIILILIPTIFGPKVGAVDEPAVGLVILLIVYAYTIVSVVVKTIISVFLLLHRAKGENT